MSSHQTEQSRPEKADASAPAAQEPRPWENATDEELLKLRIRDLKLQIEETTIANRVARLYEELSENGIQYQPPCYLATEWLCPDKVPAIGIPFCLAHPRLIRLEKTMMLEAEGESETECLRLLRHEAGHALNYAYRLYRRTRWRELFGTMSSDYDPHEYFTRPYSRQYVLHLEDNYAQAHPDEDFAETFAVWLTPHLDWETKYRGWAALKKLRYVDKLMKQIATRPPLVKGGIRQWAAARSRSTLANYYKQKRKEFAKAYPGFYDDTLRALFTDHPHDNPMKAHRFLSRHRKKIVSTISHWGRTPKYVADNLVRRLSARSKEMGLFLRTDEKDALFPTGVCLTSLVLEKYVHQLNKEDDR